MMRDNIARFMALDALDKTSEAELADVRVGADGTIYENAGTAVRTQIGELKNDLVELATTSSIPLNKLENHTITSNGYFTGSEDYDLYFAKVKFGNKFTVYGGTGYGFCEIEPYHNYWTVDGLRHLYTKQTSFTIIDNTSYVCIMALKSVIPVLVYTDSLNDTVIKLDDKIDFESVDYMPLFKNVICIGDSLTRGYNTTYGSGQENRSWGYPWALSRTTRLNVYNYGHSGATCESWLRSESELTFENFDLAIICLGRNGGLSTELERTSYQSIIDNIKNSNEHCTIFICSLPANGVTVNEIDQAINARIETIANSNNLPYIDISGYYGADKYLCGTSDPHFKTIGYLEMAKVIKRKINEYIYKNENEFMNLWQPRNNPLYIDGLIE